ncbi:MAG: EAL domain-containing protein [Gammaproteobacteria bacterium]|nr:EAL domain-containing protein [Gammaproteobacteria bacterium]
MDEAPEYIIMLDGHVCARRLAPWLKARGHHMLHAAVSLDGIHRIHAVRISTPHRLPPRPHHPCVGRRAGTRVQLPALLGLIQGLAGARGLNQVMSRAEYAMQAFPGVRSGHIHLDRKHRLTRREDPLLAAASGAFPAAGGRFRPRILSAHRLSGDYWVTLPLMAGGRPIGCLSLVARPEALLGCGAELMRAAAQSISDALERERWRTHLQRLQDLQSHRVAELSAEIAARRRAEQELRRFTLAVEQAGDSVFLIDTAGVIRYVNKAFERVTGYSRDEVVGHTPRMLRSGHHEPGFYERVWHEIRNGRTYRDVFINRRKNGSLYYEQATIAPLHDESGGISYFISTGRDITDRLATEERLRHLAEHDALTGLAIRPWFLQHIDKAIDAGEPLAVIVIDLDRFQRINDTFGPVAGDEVVQEFANRLRALAAPRMMLARLGGDEFAGLLAPIASREEAAVFADRLEAAVLDPFTVLGHELFLTISLGISLYPENGTDAQSLLKNAGSALDQAKLRGGDTREFYTAEMNARALERLTLEAHLRRALQRDQFALFYQPQVDVATGAIVGVEALVRWRQESGAIVLPSGFVPLLEETGLIIPVGEWALRTALQQIAAWRDAGLGDTRISVNISARQFRQRAFLAALSDALAQYPRSEGMLELELTESVVMEGAQSTIDMLATINDMGVRLTIDDFGTGYSSLSYLRRFPINALKIDQSFVADVTQRGDGGAITAAIITLGHELSLDVIAEGVETEYQLLFLRNHRCDVVQGFLLGRPLPAADITNLLAHRA